MSLTVCPLRDPGVFRGNFPLPDHILPTRPESAWHKMAQFSLNSITQPVESEEEGRSPIMDRQWLR